MEKGLRRKSEMADYATDAKAVRKYVLASGICDVKAVVVIVVLPLLLLGSASVRAQDRDPA